MRVGEVYVIFYIRDGKEMPMYVGQSARFHERMGDYQGRAFNACTDFRVGQAIKFLIEDLKYEIVVRHKQVDDRFKKEKDLIEELGKQYPLLNRLPAYDYAKADELIEITRVQTFCRENYS